MLVAAACAFAGAGYEQASLNQIIAEAHWSKSSFYHYFSDKRALFDHLVQSLLRRAAEQLRLPEAAQLDKANFWTEMLRFAQALEDAPRETAYLVELVMRQGESEQPLAEVRAGVNRWLVQAMEHGQGLGVVRRDLPAGLVAELAVSAFSTVYEWNRTACQTERRSVALAGELLRASMSHPGCPCRVCPSKSCLN